MRLPKEKPLKKQLLFVGDKFMANKPLQRYILREVEQKIGQPDAVHFFQESDNTLFLHLEKEFLEGRTLIIVTTKNSFAVVGKLISTVTADNQILKDNMLIPSQTQVYEDHSYLIRHGDTVANVLMAAEGEELPKILIEEEQRSALIQLFEEDEESARVMLDPLAQTHDVRLHITRIVDGWLQLHILSRRHGNIAHFIQSVRQLLPLKVIAASNVALYIIEVLQHHRRKITFAESCTGGLIASYFTKESGASNVFEGSLVTYSNALKSNWLAVSDLKLEQLGAVSAEVVEEMTEGALNVSYADYAIAVSGVAGPDGGSEYKPVGTVYVGVRSKTAHRVERLQLNGDRNYIQEQSLLHALKMLLLLDKKSFFEG
jgi:nicotinamide-nucleotide amidase